GRACLAALGSARPLSNGSGFSQTDAKRRQGRLAAAPYWRVAKRADARARRLRLNKDSPRSNKKLPALEGIIKLPSPSGEGKNTLTHAKAHQFNRFAVHHLAAHALGGVEMHERLIRKRIAQYAGRAAFCNQVTRTEIAESDGQAV